MPYFLYPKSCFDLPSLGLCSWNSVSALKVLSFRSGTCLHQGCSVAAQYPAPGAWVWTLTCHSLGMYHCCILHYSLSHLDEHQKPRSHSMGDLHMLTPQTLVPLMLSAPLLQAPDAMVNLCTPESRILGRLPFIFEIHLHLLSLPTPHI